MEPEQDRRGSAGWVRCRLNSLAGDDWSDGTAGRELIGWLYVVAGQRARRLGLHGHARDDVAQDAMTPIAHALLTSRDRYAAAVNPAAVLERVAARAVSTSHRRSRMAGLAGNRDTRVRFPIQIGGDTGRFILENQPAPTFVPDASVTDAVSRVTTWASSTTGLDLTEPAQDGIVYVLDRLAAGVSRSALLRGAHSALSADPAMAHLGFASSEASAFGLWLLGRHDTRHNAPSVLDAALTGAGVDDADIARWRRQALRFGFARPTVHRRTSSAA